MDIKNKQFLRIEHRYLKSFMAAAETENFTNAAEIACITQSGISQHIAKLEKQLGVPLFKRLGKHVVLTPAGEKLVLYAKHYLESVDALFFDLQENRSSLQGLVSYCMPPSCLLSPHFPKLLEQRKEHPDLCLNVKLIPNSDIYRLILGGEVDFGFVTEKIVNPLLEYLPFCQEEYIMVSNKRIVFQTLDGEDTLLNNRFVSYPGFEIYFDYWVKHYFPDLKHVDSRSINRTSEINSIEGAITMVKHDLGLCVFPRHCVQSYIDSKHLFECVFQNVKPFLNDIYILQLANYETPARVKQVIHWFMDMK